MTAPLLAFAVIYTCIFRCVMHSGDAAGLAAAGGWRCRYPVARGEILGVVGESGCGKVRLNPRLSSGSSRQQHWRILFEGNEIGDLSPSAGRALQRTLPVLPGSRAHRSIRTGRSAAHWKSRW